MSSGKERVNLIDRAISSARHRINKIERGIGIILRYPGHDKDMIAKEEITIRALEFYKNYFYGEVE